MNKKKELIYVAGLLCAALLWGVSYPATKIVEGYPTFYIVSIRFIVAGAALAVIFHRHFKNMNKDVLKYAFLLSAFITSMYVFATLGIKYTTSARASFFTCLTFIIVPFLNMIIYKVRISRIIVISVAICLIGIALLSYTPDLGHLGLNFGDLICLLASVAGSFHITFLDRVSKKPQIDNTLFTILLMSFVGLWSTIIALFTGAYEGVSITPFHFGTIVFLGLFCSSAAFLLQSICQEYVPANRVGVILAMEPASGCILSVLLLGETMGLTGWLGAVIVMISLLYMEIATSRAEEKKLQ